MSLPLKPPFPPMEAESVLEVPIGANWQYEPKWDGFRCVVFKDGKRVELQAKSGKSLTRYFPEMVESVRALKAKKCVLDGELVVPDGKVFSFDRLLQRIHPAKSRIERLSTETPSLFIAFDLLVGSEGNALFSLTLDERRKALESFAKKFFKKNKSIRLSPATIRIADARKWLARVGDTLDGIIAKRRDLSYQYGNRQGMQKIKNYRSVDCVVGGFRYNEGSKFVGSLLLGLYDAKGQLHHIGFTSSFKNAAKPALTKKLEPLIKEPGFTGDKPDGTSRWSKKRSAAWQPLKPKLVVEIAYDHFSGGRFRHGTTLLRWRPDKLPKQCTLDQVKQKCGNLLKLLK